MRRFLIRLGIVLAAGYVGYLGLLYGVQRTLLFPMASTEQRPFAGQLPAAAELVELPVSFGRARGVFLHGPAGRAPVLLYVHGNGELIEDHIHGFDAIRALGLHVYLLELPGYGGADGAPRFDSIREVSNAAYDWLAAQPRVDKARIVAMGTSVGGAPAAELTRNRQLRALVLQSTFSSVAAIAQGYFAPAWLVRDPFDSAQRIRDYAGPVLVAHGRRDTIIPFSHGEALARARPSVRFQPLDCGHNDCPYRGAPFIRVLDDFLRSSGVLGAAVGAAP